MRKNKVLLIEDDEGLWPLYDASLKKYKIDLVTVSSAAEAELIINTTEFDLIIVDYQLPDATGISIIERYGKAIACVLVTGMGDERLAVEALQKGGKDYLIKDIECRFLELLPGVVTKAIEQKRLQKELADTQRRMLAVFDGASDLMVLTDNDLKVLEVGQSAVKKYAIFFLQKGVMLERLVDRDILLKASRLQLDGGLVELVLGNRKVPFKLYYRRLNTDEQLFVFYDMSDASRIQNNESVIDAIAQENIELIAQNRQLGGNTIIEPETMIGQNLSIQRLREIIANIADTNANVLILGETGTGKELVANEIHSQSPRKNMPLVKLNCASIPENLVESELFGHVKGAFTGAIRDREGKFEQANGGSLFLDEVGELNMAVQAKLLRVLQEGEFESIGGSKVIRVDVRIIAATNRSLEKMVQNGTFRADLYYRLNVIPVRVPPLRERADDIILLANHFIEKFGALYARDMVTLEKEQLDYLQKHQWPGNIRELQNAIERLVILGKFQVESDIESKPEETLSKLVSLMEENALVPMAEIEKKHICNVLEHCHWRISGDNGAAKILDINPSTLRFRMQKLGITKTKKSG